MIAAHTFKGQNIAVFGLGRSGVTAALSLQAGGANVSAWDDRKTAQVEAGNAGVNLVDLSQMDWSKFDALVLSPGVPDKLPQPHWTAERAAEAGVPIICDIEIFAREVASRPENTRPKVVAITGTNGKSTTTSLIGHVLKTCGKDAQIGGNIGRGVLDLDRMHAGTYYVIELSSYQLERTKSLHANAAVFLNLSPDHLDRHGTMEAYGEAKQNIFANQTSDDSVIIGTDDEYGKILVTQLKAKNGRSIVPISARRSLGHGVSVLDGVLYCKMGSRSERICDLREAKALEGVHNWQNAAAAYAAVASLGIAPKAIGEAILSFPGLAHRMETIGRAGRVRFVNDSKATNADAARQALSSYENIFWIAGGQAKEGGIEPLMDLAGGINKAYLIGEAAPKFKRTLTRSGVNHKVSGQLDMAVMCAMRDALQSGTESPIILLSPACASFDQFKDFESRGQAFREVAEKLIRLFETEQEKKTESAA